MSIEIITKNHAISFAKWIGRRTYFDNWFVYDNKFSKWYVHMKGHVTTEELYELYLEETTKVSS